MCEHTPQRVKLPILEAAESGGLGAMEPFTGER
jgi:hypothetical protein